MKNSIKGAIAAGGAAVILLGGAGSLAYWNSTDTIAGGTITSGDLVIDATRCDDAEWTVSNTVEGVTQATFGALEDIVRGDKLTKTCTVDIVAVGTNLRARLGATGGAETGTLEADDYDVTSTFQINGVT